MNNRTPRCAFDRLFLLGLALALTAGTGLLAPAPGEAQVCALPTSPKFAGHSLPLDSDPVPEAMRFVRAFPALDYTSLVGLYAAPDNSDRLFAVERNGRIHVFENQDDVASSRVFLDIDPAVDSDASEQGLLGLAFDPDYATNRRFFVNYTASVGCSAPASAGCSKIIRFETDPADPDRALPTSAFPILEFPQPFDNHNGGAIAFGPDGLLYVATGDGGSGGDPFRNAQNLASRLGKILRLDVRAGAQSLVPTTNPYVGVGGTDPLIYHSGLRNPWRMTFDRTTGDLLIADVGQSRREEVHRVRAGGAAGQNFGWDYCEGTRNYRDGALCSDIQSTPPVLEYDHTAPVGGEVIIGGYVYRGDAFPELFGAYLFADAASGHVWAWDGQDPVDPWNPGNPAALIGSAPAGIASFGEDREGEIYAVSSISGQIFRLERSSPGGGGPPFPALLSQTGLFSNVATLTAAPGLIEYDVTTPLWSDGASKRRWMALPGEGRIAFHARQAWEFPIGTAFVKHFELPLVPTGTRRIETRVFLRQTQRWIGVTYRWNSAGTDATLQTDALDETISLGGGTQQDWHYPSTSECLGCHTEVSGRVLGARTRQLEEPRTYAQGTQRQIEAWNCAQLFDFEIGDRSRYEFGRSLADATATRTHRVRSYAAANCEMCHQPGGPAPGDLDLRFTRGVGEWNVIDVPPSEGDLGFPNARRILPGNRFLSIAWLRQAVSDVSVRMARGTRRSDTTAVNLFGDWIVADVASVDSDADGVLDATDVCPGVADPLQVDTDGDTIGDRCDPDALPDLVVASQTTPTGTIFPGQSLAFSATLENTGAGASGTFPVTFHLSADALLDPAVDIPVGHCWANALAAGGSTACSTNTARIPTTFTTGSPNPVAYRWITCANRAEVERDRNPTNACSVSPTTVSVPEPRAMLIVALASLALRSRIRDRLRARDESIPRA